MTEPRYLLDSNICICLLEGLSDLARARAERCAPGELVTSSIAYGEVVRGIGPADERACASVEAFFRIVDVLPFDRTAALVYRRLPFARGRFDRLIGAHAVALDLTVVTNNVPGFADVPDLRIENWTLPS